MKTLSQLVFTRRSHQAGMAIIEFALIASVFFILLIGIMEMGRMLFYWNSAAEATRLGARIAVVCDLGDADIKAKMQSMLAILSPGDINIDYQPAGCSVNTCESVTVSIVAGVAVATFIPYVPLALTLPPFSTTLPRESMQSTFGGAANPVCM